MPCCLRSKPVRARRIGRRRRPSSKTTTAADDDFRQPGRSERARRALRNALGGRPFEHLLGLLAFIRTAHYWTVLHPDLQSEDDILELLRVNEELARLLLQDPEAARCDEQPALFRLEDLRGGGAARAGKRQTRA